MLTALRQLTALRPERPLSQIDLDRLPHANRKPREPDDRQADDEEHRTWCRVGHLALHADHLADPAARPGYPVEEQQDPADAARQAEDEPGQRADPLDHRRPAP